MIDSECNELKREMESSQDKRGEELFVPKTDFAIIKFYTGKEKIRLCCFDGMGCTCERIELNRIEFTIMIMIADVTKCVVELLIN